MIRHQFLPGLLEIFRHRVTGPSGETRWLRRMTDRRIHD